MEVQDTTVKGAGISYNHTLTQHKHYYAGYANQAEDNLKAVLKLLTKRFGLR